MALPLIIGGVALAAGIFGAKKGVDAKNNYAKAKSIVGVALEDLENSNKKLSIQRSKTSDDLQTLGEARLRAEGELITRFLATVKLVNQINYQPITIGDIEVSISIPELQAMEVSSYQAADLLKDGIGAISSGVLTGIGASGLASTIGVASTGTAIGSLTGVAATNATLAWLGGGSLAAGGMGMAGGMAVLGGAIMGPVIAVMGYSAAKKSEHALSNAFEKEYEIRVAAEQFQNGIAVLATITQRCEEMQEVMRGIAQRFHVVLDQTERNFSNKNKILLRLREESERKKAEDANRGFFVRIWRRITGQKTDYSFKNPFDFNNFSAQEKTSYTIMMGYGYSLNALLKAKVIDDDGAVTDESEAVVIDAKKILEAI